MAKGLTKAQIDYAKERINGIKTFKLKKLEKECLKETSYKASDREKAEFIKKWVDIKHPSIRWKDSSYYILEAFHSITCLDKTVVYSDDYEERQQAIIDEANKYLDKVIFQDTESMMDIIDNYEQSAF